MAANPPIAAFGSVPVSQALKPATDGTKKIDTSKYHDLLTAIHDAAYPKGDPDMQTRLEWDPIEGEILGTVLTQDIISGTMFTEVDHPFFHFASVKDTVDKMVADSFVEVIKDKKFLVPSVSVAKMNLNKLMISWKGMGREELVRMVQAFQVSMQEQETRDPLSKAMRSQRL